MQRPDSIQALLPVQIQTVLEFLNKAQRIEDLTDIQQYRPDLSEADLASYSIGEKSAQNLLDTRSNLRAQRYNNLEEVLDVEGIGENKVLDIVEFIWQPAEEIFRQELFKKTLGENWKVDYWRYALSPEAFQQLNESEVLLQAFIADKVLDIANEKHSNYLIGALAKELLKKSFPDRVESLTAEIQFASWWMRFDEDNWFNFDTISSIIRPFINYYDKQRGAYIDPVFYRGFKTGGTLTDGITPDDLVVSINPAEYAIAIWGIALFD
jgi:hypothetical protein